MRSQRRRVARAAPRGVRRRHPAWSARTPFTKVQRPPLRAETLRRDRLLEWLTVKIHHRIVFVTADAGYGKTTLLADFARRSRLPTLWYRLDEDDRNWVSFVNYLVAAGRQIDPDFASATAGLLREMGTSGPSRGTIVETLLPDFQELAPMNRRRDRGDLIERHRIVVLLRVAQLFELAGSAG